MMRPASTHSPRTFALMLSLLLALAGLWPRPSTGTEPPRMTIEDVVSVGMTVSDLERSTEFYRDLLRFEVISAKQTTERRVALMQLGDEQIELTQYVPNSGRPMPADSCSNDRWFQHIAIITSDMDSAYRNLDEKHVQHASVAPQQLPDWNVKAGGIRAYYFRDPDGHFLELLQFPEDKGLAKWHERSKSLFLGIDHTAIVVADTERALKFYRDQWGMKVVGTSENYGPEQERLNNVDGAHLRITTLRASSGPGIELLEYLQPRTGRPYPTDASPRDLFHWQVNVRVGQLEGSFKPVPTQFVRDPDGHALERRIEPNQES